MNNRPISQNWLQFQKILASYEGKPIESLLKICRMAKCSNQLGFYFLTAGYLEATENSFIYVGKKEFTSSDWAKIRATAKKAKHKQYTEIKKSVVDFSQVSDTQLLEELKKRGYTGQINKPITL